MLSSAQSSRRPGLAQANRDERIAARAGAQWRPPPWYRRIDTLALFLFAAGSCFLFGKGQQRALGAMLAAAFVIAHVRYAGVSLRKMLPLPPELVLFSLWVIWSGLTGPLVATDFDLFLNGFFVVVQMLILVWLSYAVLSNGGSETPIFMGLLAGAVIQIGFVLLGTDQYTALISSEDRLEGLTSNSNNLGFMMVWGVVSAMAFWRKVGRRHLLWHALILVFLPSATFVMLASGSRKSTLAMGLVLLLWAMFGPRPIRGFRNKAISIVIGVVILIGFVNVLPDFIERTTVGRRFQQFVDDGGGSIQDSIYQHKRFELYLVGLEVFGGQPLAGVGVNNFTRHSEYGAASHSNFIEPLATTGLIGFILYQAFFFIPLLRIRRLYRIAQGEDARYLLRVGALALLAILLIGVGAPHHANTQVFLLLSAISYLTWRNRRWLAPRWNPIGPGTDS